MYSQVKIDNEKLSVLLFTSGTTSKPKGVILSQKNICNNVHAYQNHFKMLPTDTLLSFQLFPFLKEEEIRSCGCLNIKFYNGFMRYCKRRFDSLIQSSILLDNSSYA